VDLLLSCYGDIKRAGAGLGADCMVAASNMSGITTTQGAIAEDLDAYATATWFTSVYLVCIDPQYGVKPVDIKNR
jgi:hypothetical protein